MNLVHENEVINILILLYSNPLGNSNGVNSIMFQKLFGLARSTFTIYINFLFKTLRTALSICSSSIP